MALGEIEFHAGIPEPVPYAMRLIRKAWRKGARLLVTAPPAQLAELDRLLWTFEEREFLPHVRMPGAAAATAARSPVWLAASAELQDVPPVLVNLGADAPAEPGRFERLIELVGAAPESAEAGRERWRAYKAAGFAVRRHEAQA